MFQPDKSDFILDFVKEVGIHIKPEIIGHLRRRVKSKISTKIKMVSSRISYPFGISSARDSQIEDERNTNPEYVHMEECNNGELHTGKIMLQW